MCYLNDKQLEWCETHENETLELLKELGSIPAPSHNEHMRAEFILKWFEENGAKGAYIDDALNVIWPVGVTENNSVAVLMAHTDIVFPDTDRLEVREENGCLYAPGIGDDTAIQKPNSAGGILICQVGIMRDHDDQTLPGDFFQNFHNLHAGFGIQRTGGLISQ